MDEQKEETSGAAPTPPAAPPTKKHRVIPRPLAWIGGILLAIAVILYIASYFIDEPLRRITEQKLNRDLKGYSVRLPELHLQLIGLSITLKGVTIRQQAHPDPPIVVLPYLKASVHWREILSGKLVAELRLDDAKLHINLPQLKEEAAKKTPIKQRGWQQALEDIYPLKINLLKINNASISYIDQDPKRPLVLSELNISADNIRNIHLPDKVYPSPFHLDTVIFGTGRGAIDGKANFLAEPTPAVKAALKLEKIPLDYFKPILARSNLNIEGGELRATGDIEYDAPKLEIAHLSDVTITGVKVDYLHSGKTAAAEKRRAKAVKKTAKELSNKPRVLISVDRFRLAGSNVGMVNEAGGKKYRLYLTGVDFTLTNFSNQFSRGAAQATLHGMFMGSGVTNAHGNFRSEKKSPDFDLYLKIDKTRLTSLNDLLRAYGKFDVTAGTFSLVTELHVKENRVTGYLKPFFKDMKVRVTAKKGVLHAIYTAVVAGVAKLLENPPRQQVATRVEIAGPLQQPKTSTWQVVVELLRNAFIKAILPTFDREARAARR
jgi:hypothetical protein